MEPFHVHILGCGSALPTLRHFPSMQVVECRGKLFMVDCGEGAQLQLRRSGLSFSKLQAIFISHLHGDHCFGLIGMVSTFGLLGRTAPLHVYAPAALQPMLDAHAQEFTTLELGEPLLSRPADNQQLLYALLMDLHVPAGTQLVLVGHGSPDTHNPAYEALQAHIDKEGLPIHVGVFAEGEQPDFAAVLQRLQAQPDKNVLLAPLLLANGYHARRDILGDAPESWQSRLTAAGYAVTASDHGLGEYPGVRQLFVRKARRLLGE
jgi:glyoxylase-like metal-dependent hydrolase (beta-lactamase superfamily II)